MSKERGFMYGLTLKESSEGIKSLEYEVNNEVDEYILRLDKKINDLQVKKNSKELSKQSLIEKLTKLLTVKNDLEQLKKDNPAEFSLFRGIFYSILCILLILGDIAILGAVIAQFLNQSWRAAIGNKTFGNLIYTNPIKAFTEFPDLFSLTLSILMMGFFLKIFLDSLNARKIMKEKGKTNYKLLFGIITTIFILSFIAVLVMAIARLTVPIGSGANREAELFQRITSMILGLALPYVSAGYFIKAIDKFSNIFRLLKLNIQEIFLTFRINRYESSILAITQQINSDQIFKSKISSDDYKKKLLSERVDEFIQGYDEGVIKLLTPEGTATVYQKLKPLAVSKILRR